VNVAWTLTLSTLGFAMAMAVMALSAYVTVWVGMLSFATVAFAALGGYISAKTMGSIPHVGVLVTLLIAAVAGALAACVIGLILLRVTGHWLALATLAIVLVTEVLVVNLPGLTGGSTGTVVPSGVGLWWCFGTVAVVGLCLQRLRSTRFGAAADVIREDSAVAEGLGIPVKRVQFAAFVLSGSIAAVGGVLEAGLLQYISPTTFYVPLAISVIACVVLGGAYHWTGAVVGAIVFTALPTIIQQFTSQASEIVIGAVLLVVMIYLPGGLIDPRRRRKNQELKRSGGRSAKRTSYLVARFGQHRLSELSKSYKPGELK
jgi:branched-chain amino acid transport system permease protein